MKNMIILMMMVINENEGYHLQIQKRAGIQRSQVIMVVIGMIMVGMVSPNKIKVMVASLIIIWILVICIHKGVSENTFLRKSKVRPTPPSIGLGVSLKGSKRIFEFNKV